MRPVEEILDLARWAPSGDNTQPWQFEIISDDHVLIHAFDTRNTCVYDLEGHASQLAHGALLETLRIAATSHGLRTAWSRQADHPETHMRYDVRFHPDASVTPDPLLTFIKSRTVQRRPMWGASITADERAELEAAAYPLSIHWFESLTDRHLIARLNFRNAKIRLTTQEAYEVHRRVIEWGARFSHDRIPEAALGVDPITAKLMRWIMHSWGRVEFFNKWLAGTVMPRIQLDFIPGVACSAHACLFAPAMPATVEQRNAAGAAVQRFWLTCEKLGLQHQPEMTPLIFSQYIQRGIRFTDSEPAMRLSQRLDAYLEKTPELEQLRTATWLGRIGRHRRTPGRSLRKPIA